MTAHNFAIKFCNEVQHLGRAVERQLQSEAEQRLHTLAANRHALTAATVAIEQPLQHNFSHLYVARIVVFDEKQKKRAIATRAASAQVAL